jgi:hypothetical protein
MRRSIGIQRDRTAALARSRRGVAVAVIALAVAAIAVASTAGTGAGGQGRLSTGQAGEPFTVSPGQGPPFTVVTVSGAGCTGPSPSVISELVSAAGAAPGEGTIPGTNAIVFLTPDATGAWSGSFTIPPIVAPGQYRVVARCLPDQFNPQPADYAPQPFEVLADGLAALSVAPRQASAGVDVPLTVSGTLCRGTAADVDVQVALAQAEDAEEFVARELFTPDSDGNWSGRVTIPAGPATTYRVTAVCSVDGGQFFIYLPPVDVVVGAAVPVPGRPTFTG